MYQECHYFLNPTGLNINMLQIINDNDYGCFHYALTLTQYHEQIKNHQEKNSSFKLFVNKFNWDGIDYPTSRNEFQKFEKNNTNIASAILYVDVIFKLIKDNSCKYDNINKIIKLTYF